jgi:hypothetical protein
MDTVSDQELDFKEKEAPVEGVKLTLTPESPIRLGSREIPILNDFAQYAEILFAAVEKFCIKEGKIVQNYTVLEIPRVGHFREEKSFEYKDEQLGTSVQASPTKITLVVNATTQISRATQKYLLV